MFVLRRLLLRCVIVSAVLQVFAARTAHTAESPDVDYARDIRTLLREKCFSCHSARKQEGGLRLDAAVLIRRGGDSGPAIKERASQKSLLIERVTADDDARMPPAESSTRLSDKEVQTLRSWIDSGAPAPDETIPESPTKHWSFQSPVASGPPDSNSEWVRSDIDRFVAAEHQRVGVTAVGEASRATLLRRLSLDLTGLPPTRDELQAFLADSSEATYETAVNRLLASPRYGERWARHFMDIWRYSDPSGYGKEIRDGREHIWRWRDWIVESLNADKGYDRMIVEMLAADEAAPDDRDALRATGFLARNWYKFNRNVWLDNIVEHSTKAFVGLTVNCARCHEHKYDPIEQVAYYRMRAIFETHDVRDDPVSASAAMLVRTYDAHPDRETFLFRQGNADRADKELSLSPGLPELFGSELSVEPVELPASAWYPALHPDARAAALQAAKAKIETARAALKNAQTSIVVARRKLETFQVPAPSVEAVTAARSPDVSGVVLEDDFAKLDESRWQIESGQWSAKDGRLIQSRGETTQHRLVSTEDHPRDFRAAVRFRITGGDQYRSVGLGFDGDGRAMNAVYLSVSGPKVQFTSQGTDGRWQYPQAGAATHAVKLGLDYVLEVAVRDQLLNILIDGDLKVAFNLPAGRKAGKFSIWTFSATGEFDSISVSRLPAETKLQPAGNVPSSTTPSKPATRADLELAVQHAEAAQGAAKTQLSTIEVEHRALQARIDAELVKYALVEGSLEALQTAAGHTMRQLAVQQHENQIAQTRLKIAQGKLNPPTDAKAIQALAALPQQLSALQKKLEAAQVSLASESREYPPLGPTYPRMSSGRRLAYARWITDRDNPLTARVLVNHVWLRHFDTPLVERLFDFGLRSDQPRHAALLDWLAVEFMEDGWSLKKLHQRIVMSGVYRLDSSPAVASAVTRKQDPDNATLWRMNARRMEAEAVRDSVLFLGDSLDLTSGGPPVEHTRGQDVLRRSLYFRQDKERQMVFLSLFDGAKVNECYERKATVAPQQALAMFNSRIASQQAARISGFYSDQNGDDFIKSLFDHVLCRPPSSAELNECREYLTEFQESPLARSQVALVLLNHNDFVTIR